MVACTLRLHPERVATGNGTRLLHVFELSFDLEVKALSCYRKQMGLSQYGPGRYNHRYHRSLPSSLSVHQLTCRK